MALYVKHMLHMMGDTDPSEFNNDPAAERKGASAPTQKALTTLDLLPMQAECLACNVSAFDHRSRDN
jgi:hypothetical protein